MPFQDCRQLQWRQDRLRSNVPQIGEAFVPIAICWHPLRYANQTIYVLRLPSASSTSHRYLLGQHCFAPEYWVLILLAAIIEVALFIIVANWLVSGPIVPNVSALYKQVKFSESRRANGCYLPRILGLLALTLCRNGNDCQTLNFTLNCFLDFSCRSMSNHWLFSLCIFNCFHCLRLTFQHLTLIPTIQCFQVPVAHHFLHIVRFYFYFVWFIWTPI